ncbi:Erg28 [Penicillium cf. griseofulvum]|uniref:Erg28 n=1 Tax=Penicillium cf. griseofulvum TaxID=2972120 RepID=A0A9W9T657_9EURO|nr:Erg28 [Penicillium cf. griseofulvum]KAJ5422363.1 Erg28 [Penicillium cf. griseofulvum]KAJ5428546.1 Erg28 [Penicillium cf. griseofulvum]
MDQYLAYFPQTEGFLPKWLFFVSVVSALNSLQAYNAPKYTSQLYSNGKVPASPLSGRIFGTWTFLSAVIRMTAAYNITNSVAYDLGMWTYGIALAHFIGEIICGDASLEGRFLSPLVVASSSLVWMFTQRAAYLG